MQQKIIHLLRQKDGHVSGEEISRALAISRAAVWKYVQDLRRLGYRIAAVPHKGYRLVSAPDKLLPWEIHCGLKTKRLGRDIVYYERVASTMDEAFRLGVEGRPEGTLVVSEGQSRGRGRMGREWVSPKSKGIYMSLLLRPAASPNDTARLTLLAAVAVCEAVRTAANVEARIKWPNDILVSGRKLGGLLTEMRAELDRVGFIVLGIGLNVNSARAQLVSGATSLKAENGRTFSRAGLVREILAALERWYGIWERDGFDPVFARWRELTATLGRRVTWSDAGGRQIEGEAVDLAADGGLLIRGDDGAVVKKMSGDVVAQSA